MEYGPGDNILALEKLTFYLDFCMCMGHVYESYEKLSKQYITPELYTYALKSGSYSYRDSNRCCDSIKWLQK